MARGTSLSVLTTQLRAEIGQAVNPALGVDFNTHLQQALRIAQQVIHENNDWAFMMHTASKTVSAGLRYYDFPANLPLEGIREIKQISGGSIYTLIRGISFDEQAIYDSDLDERADFCQKWDVVHTGTNSQIEVWPIPSTNAGTLKIRGKRQLSALTDSTDTADMDDTLIILTAAAGLLVEKRPKMAQAKAGLADTLLNNLLAATMHGREEATVGAPDGFSEAPRRERLYAPRG